MVKAEARLNSSCTRHESNAFTWEPLIYTMQLVEKQQRGDAGKESGVMNNKFGYGVAAVVNLALGQ